MQKFFFYFAATGWILGLVTHLFTFADIDVSEQFSFIWLLHVGIFVVWIPAIIDLKKNQELKNYQRSAFPSISNQLGLLRIILKNTPYWLRVVAVAGMFYAIINFLLFLLSHNGTPAIMNGKFVLQNHGTIIRELTEKEYHHYNAKEIRAFSGHWIAFYGMAMALLYPYKKPAIAEFENRS